MYRLIVQYQHLVQGRDLRATWNVNLVLPDTIVLYQERIEKQANVPQVIIVRAEQRRVNQRMLQEIYVAKAIIVPEEQSHRYLVLQAHSMINSARKALPVAISAILATSVLYAELLAWISNLVRAPSNVFLGICVTPAQQYLIPLMESSATSVPKATIVLKVHRLQLLAIAELIILTLDKPHV